jgi:hypothetical protein
MLTCLRSSSKANKRLPSVIRPSCMHEGRWFAQGTVPRKPMKHTFHLEDVAPLRFMLKPNCRSCHLLLLTSFHPSKWG